MRDRSSKTRIADVDSGPAGAELTQAPKSNRSGRRLVLAATASAALLAICGGLWFSGIAPKLLHLRPANLLAGPVFLRVPEIITNLNGSDGQDSYAKLRVTLELTNAKTAKVVNADMPRLIDMFEAYLRAMHPSELRGASGTYRLREALIARARIATAPAAVQDVLFEELIVQ